MWNEHFGIGIVEMMAAGLLVIAHNSGGPKSDIVVPLTNNNDNSSAMNNNTTTGYLATTVEEYANTINRLFVMCQDNPNEAMIIRRNAMESSKRFSDDVFAKSFEQAILDLKLK